MRTWLIFVARASSKCYICDQWIHKGRTEIAWHPQTKQAMHLNCFEDVFHPSNVQNARKIA